MVLLIAVAGVIITHAAHRRLTGWHWLTALAGGVNRYRADRQNCTGRRFRRAGAVLGPWWQLRARERAGQEPGDGGAGAWPG